MNKTIKEISKYEMVHQGRMDLLYHRVSIYIDQARSHIQHTIDSSMVRTYWLIGQEIVEEELDSSLAFSV
ncbi:MAG: hypothetical protein ACYCQI_15855 [Gammaproteobacteria bacterium]